MLRASFVIYQLKTNSGSILGTREATSCGRTRCCLATVLCPTKILNVQLAARAGVEIIAGHLSKAEWRLGQRFSDGFQRALDLDC